MTEWELGPQQLTQVTYFLAELPYNQTSARSGTRQAAAATLPPSAAAS